MDQQADESKNLDLGNTPAMRNNAKRKAEDEGDEERAKREERDESKTGVKRKK